MALLSYSAIIAAGGSGSRFGSNKLREKVGGKAVLSHSIDRFEDDEDCVEVLVCAGVELREWMEANPLVFSSPKLRVVDGGASRAESVRNGALVAEGRALAIHDAARPNFSAELLVRLKREVKPEVGVVPALPVADTLAYIAAADAQPGADDFFGSGKAGETLGHIERHVERAGLHVVQTPQFFYRASYLQAVEQAGDGLAGFSDDSSLYVAAGYGVVAVPGLPGNLKLTVPADLQLLLKLMGGGSEKKHKDRYGGLGW